MNLTILGIIFTAVGALILLLNNIFTGGHTHVFGQKWNKRYEWMGKRPLYRDTETKKLKINWKRKVYCSWFIPPKYMLEILGFLFILIGTILQIGGLSLK